MHESIVEGMRLAVGFEEEDAANVRSLASSVEPFIPTIVSRFLERFVSQEGARAVLTGGEEQLQRQGALLSAWLHDLFTSRLDERYYEKRHRIGIAHVRVDLPQHFMLAGMELIWSQLEERIRGADLSDADAKLRSLHRLLTLETAVILESYKESYTEQVRKLERIAVKEELTRAEHLAEIGQLAASLAHEIKNPLAGISGAIQVIQDAMLPDDVHQPIITEILAQIGRLDATVKDLLQYARPTPPKATIVVLDEVLTRLLTVLGEEPAVQRVRIKYDRRAARLSVYADDAQIEQLLMNLIINAAHASDDGGVIHLGTAQGPLMVQLTVTDEGRGMNQEVREKAFEPFFTTKARGTGLGLSICRRITEAHGGTIELTSELGKGTRVVVSLPRADRFRTREAQL